MAFYKNGFTLLESLIATVLFVTGVLAITHAFNIGIISSFYLKDTDIALNLAKEKIEELKIVAFADLADSEPTAGGINSPYSRFLISVDVEEGQDPMPVDVVVGWDVKGGQDTIVLTTLRTNY